MGIRRFYRTYSYFIAGYIFTQDIYITNNHGYILSVPFRVDVVCFVKYLEKSETPHLAQIPDVELTFVELGTKCK